MAIDQQLRVALYPPRSGLPGATLADIIALAGGGGGNYFSADLVGTATRAHTITGAGVTVGETYTDGLLNGSISKSATKFEWVGIDLLGGGLTNLALETVLGTFNLGAGVLPNLSTVSGGPAGIVIDAAVQSISMISGLSTGLQAFDDDAAAGVGGLSLGDLFQTTGAGAAPLNAAGIVLIKQ